MVLDGDCMHEMHPAAGIGLVSGHITDTFGLATKATITKVIHLGMQSH